MIYLMRHGQDNENYIGGWSNVDLTDNGIEQVTALTPFIKNNLQIDKIYSSDVKRTVTTANIVAQTLNIKPEYTSKLRELNKGLLTGMNVSEAKALYPMYFKKMDIETKYPDGESMLDLYKRVKLLLQEFSNKDNALIVTHRGIINMIYFILNNRKPTMDKEQFNVTYASIHQLDMLNKTIEKIR